METKRHPKILQREHTALLIIDIQQRIIGAMAHPERVIENTLKLIKGFRVMEIPIYYTEQYPKGLGPTESTLQSALEGITAKQKMTFSCNGAEDLFETLRNSGKTHIVLTGVESHVCVQQTALDLLANGFLVVLAADAVSSRRELDYSIALDRMRAAGVDITTSEAVLFELLTVCGTDEFKSVSKIVK